VSAVVNVRLGVEEAINEPSVTLVGVSDDELTVGPLKLQLVLFSELVTVPFVANIFDALMLFESFTSR
jgi:hypothetical protein